MKEVFAQNPVFLILAIAGTTLYVGKMIIFLVAGDGDGEVDTDINHDIDGGDQFSLVSVQSILAFFMGTGWIGLAAKREWHLNDLNSLLTAVGFGFIMMLFSAFITFKIKRFNSIPKMDLNEAKGKIGRAYTNIPAKGKGIGQIEIVLSETKRVLQASSNGDAINSFDSVKVTGVDDAGNLIVEKA